MGLETFVQQLKKISKGTQGRIEIVAVDGHPRKFDAPISVKDVLAQYPGHSLFLSANRSRPLHMSVLLQPGKVYCLTQFAKQRQSSSERSIIYNGQRRSDSKVGMGDVQKGSRHVSFASRPSYIDPIETPTEKDSSGEVAKGGGSGKEVLSGSEGKVTRVKVVLSRKQYEELIRGGEDKVEALLYPLLNECKLGSFLSVAHPHAPRISS